MRTLLECSEDMTGKTIEKCVWMGDDSAMSLLFTDGTAILITCDSNCDCRDGIGSLNVDQHPGTTIAHGLELMSLEESQAEQKRMNDEYQAMNDRRERADYERLKAKFDCGSAAEGGGS